MSPKVIVVTGSNRGDTVIATPLAPRSRRLPNMTLVELDADDLGTIDSAVADVERIAPEGLDDLWNNLGVYNVDQNLASFLPLLEKRATKKIVSVSSVAASFDFTKNVGSFLTQLDAPFIYAASKATLNMSAWYVHNQLNSSGFTIVLIHPGVVLTEMNITVQGIPTEESPTKMMAVVDAPSAQDEFVFKSYDGSKHERI
ncbi:hypothetical protein V1517DRAFT_353617 [Lipomyces orientalis]|uniref:Uncharacterized protein n=1 Tax=Lipomyces orientalis TaxID=1233043 RepID=A0ACC3TKF5_9ASCO